jgi:hypothetical protein
MDVYAPANQPLVICAGDEQETSGLRAALANFLGGLAIVGLASLFVQQVFGASLFGEPAVRSGSADTASQSPSFYVENGTIVDGGMTEPAVDAAVQGSTAAATSGLSPGLAFFAGGAFVLVALVAIWHVR